MTTPMDEKRLQGIEGLFRSPNSEPGHLRWDWDRGVDGEPGKEVLDLIASYRALEKEVKDFREYIGPLAELQRMDHSDIGANTCADLMRGIAENGKESGVFGGEKLEAAAQAILRIRKENARVRKTLELVRPIVQSAPHDARCSLREMAFGEEARKKCVCDCGVKGARAAIAHNLKGEGDE